MIIDSDEKRRKRELEIKEQEEKENEEREKAKKNNNFVMVYRDHMPEMRWLMKKSGVASSILNFIMEHMDNKNALCCSYAVLEDYFDVSTSTVKRSIKLLYENGFIDIMKSGTSNIYIVNNEVAWTSWRNQKEYCKFEGNMLVSKKENKDYFYRNQFDKFKELRDREHIKE
jgi:Fe2+ or Zn2+ uptake regulation protein